MTETKRKVLTAPDGTEVHAGMPDVTGAHVGMPDGKKFRLMPGNGGGRGSIILILVVNLLLAGAIVVLLYSYSTGYRDNIREQNLSNISNINQSSANIGSFYFQSRQNALSDIVKYVTSENLSADEALSYIHDSNSGDTTFELVGTDARGFAAIPVDSGFEPVDYSAQSYKSFARVFSAADSEPEGEIYCTQEFTDGITARKSFALYARLLLPDAKGTLTPYTLLAVTESSTIADLIDLEGGYEGMATVLVNEDGDYVFGSPDFKSDNLFEYFYVFNGLTLDDEQALAEAFPGEGGSGRYYYDDSKGRPCVFVYASVPDTRWYSVSSVPLQSFHDTSVDMGYVLMIVLLMLALMAFDIAWLLYSNRRLKASALREKVASSAKTDFLSRMSHDIRTPLNVIIGSTVLARDEKDPTRIREHLENIDRSGRFLLSLVNDILDLNKVESGKMELYPTPYSFSQFKANMTSIIEPLSREKGVTFTMEGDDIGNAYLLDAVRVNQVFFNLLSNAVKFTAPGGWVRFECRVLPGQDGIDTLEFEVADNGQGMSERFQKRMFESFSQEHELDDSKAGGTGLGLAIVKSLVELMGGTITVSSAPEQGTTFHVTIPAEKASDELAADDRAMDETVSLDGRRVLLFEDNEINAQIARALLERRGIIVDHAADGEAGVAVFETCEPSHYDAILMDLRMPKMDGFAATRAIRGMERADAGSVPIIAMTANAYEDDVRRCLDVGMNAHLSKPIDPKALFTTLAREIGASQAQ